MMRNTLIIGLMLLLFSLTSMAQVNYVRDVVITTPSPVTIDLLSQNSTEYIARNEVILSSGFDVKNANASKYFLGKIDPTIPIPQYAFLNKDLSSTYASTTNGILYFTYEEKYQTGIALNYKIYNSKRNLVSALPTLTITGVGSNFFQLNMNTILSGITINSTEESFYILEVTNSKNESWLLRFQYTPTN